MADSPVAPPAVPVPAPVPVVGTKETREALIGAAALAGHFYKAVKKVGMPTNWANDIMILKNIGLDLAENADFRATLQAAVSGISACPNEVKNMKPLDAISLIKDAVAEFDVDAA